MAILSQVRSVNYTKWSFVEPVEIPSLSIEKFDLDWSRVWIHEHWNWSVGIAACYLMFVYLGPRWMQSRPPLVLKKFQIFWNLGFAIFSIFGFIRIFPEIWSVWMGPLGMYRSLCVRDKHNEATAFWAWAMTLSKTVELGDTALIILQKKQLRFAHYYHHLLALLSCWFAYPYYEPILRWFGNMNYFVHSVLYSYLFLLSFGSSTLLKSFSNALIVLELLQMIIGLFANTYTIWIKVQGGACARDNESIICFTLIYGSFLFAFGHLLRSRNKKFDRNVDMKSKNKVK